MSTRASILLLLIAIVMGVAAGGGAYMYIENQTRGLEVLAVKRDIKIGESVTAGDLRKEYIPVRFESLTTHAVLASNYETIVNRPATTEIRAGELVLYSQFDPTGPKRDVLNRLELTGRAFSIAVGKESSAANIILPGDFVDVIATFDPGKQIKSDSPGDEEPDSENVTRISEALSAIRTGGGFALPAAGLQVRTILRKVPVLGVGQRFSDPRYSLEDVKQSYNIVTLKVSQEQAELLTFAQALGGRLTLTLRNPKAPDDDAETEPMNLEKFLLMTR